MSDYLRRSEQRLTLLADGSPRVGVDSNKSGWDKLRGVSILKNEGDKLRGVSVLKNEGVDWETVSRNSVGNVRRQCRARIQQRLKSYLHVVFLVEQDESLIRNLTETYEAVHREKQEAAAKVNEIRAHAESLVDFKAHCGKEKGFHGIFAVEDEVFSLVFSGGRYLKLCRNSLGKTIPHLKMQQEISDYIGAFLGELRILSREVRSHQSYCFWDGHYFGTLRRLLNAKRVDTYPYSLELEHKQQGLKAQYVILQQSFSAPARDARKMFARLGDTGQVMGLREEDQDNLFDLRNFLVRL